MNVYCFSCRQQFLENESSNSEDSVYLTPETSFTDSILKKCQSPSSCDAYEWKFSETRLFREPSMEPSSHETKRLSDTVFDQENNGILPSALAYCMGSPERTPLKCITTLFNSDQQVRRMQPKKTEKKSIGSASRIRKNDSSLIEKPDEKNFAVAKLTQYGLPQSSKLLEELETECEIWQEKMPVDSETTLAEIPKPNYGSISHNDSNERAKSAFSPKFRSSNRISSSSVLRKCRLVHLKRLFSNPINRVRAYYAKYLQKFRRNHYQSLNTLNGEVSHNLGTASECDSENATEESKTSSMQELLQTVIAKLSSMESELKELKSLVKEKNNQVTMTCFRPPPPPPLPPPPPPFPSNFVNHSSTPKRKADLTTPENQQLAKRPSRIQEQRGQFSVTVEDLRNVKLRKIGNRTVKKIHVEKNSVKEPLSLPSSARTALRYKRNRIIDEELSDIATELFSPRNRSTLNETTFLCSPRSNSSLSSNIYDHTPKRIKCRSSIFRKRKELSDESPTRKRLNSS